jgi:hypothetical protein
LAPILAGKLHRTSIERPPDDAVESVGASPLIIDDVRWQRAQPLRADPAWNRRSSTPARADLLRGPTSCGVCSASMIGQWLKVKRDPYLDYSPHRERR